MLSPGEQPRLLLKLDTESDGRYSVEALREYREMGYVSEYFSVDLELITKENVAEYMEEIKRRIKYETLETDHKDLSIRKKLILCFGFTSLLLLVSNLLLYKEVNRSINRIDQIYVSNITLNDLSDALTSTHEEVYEYLSTKSSSALENYYRSGQQFRDLLEDLNGETRDNRMLLLEKNIKNMSDTYLATADNTVAAKRGRNIQRYKDCYAEAEELYRYITTYIDNLNRQQFQVNSSSYKNLLVSLQYMEVVSTAILIFVAVVNIIFWFCLPKYHRFLDSAGPDCGRGGGRESECSAFGGYIRR